MHNIKKIVLAVIIVVITVFITLFFLHTDNNISKKDQLVLEKTLDISRDYAALRYQTDTLLLTARDYPTYIDWKKEMDVIIEKWADMEQKALTLASLATKMTNDKISFHFTNTALAYDKQEISNIFDRAPAGKKIATLAKHLGVDAKKAYAILTQDQAQVQADAWNEAGDTFQKLETTAVAIKDTCKVVTFVGTIALTGGTAAIATGSTLGKVAVVVAGSDLTLEVTDDAAKIALGNNNKISAIIGSAREVTEPVAAILMISTLPNNLTKAIDKLSAVTFAADQLNTSIQDGKVIGIQLPATTKNSDKKTAIVSVLEKEEVEKWIQTETNTTEEETTKNIEDILGLHEEKTKETGGETNTDQISNEKKIQEGISFQNKESLVGIWEGIMKFTPNQKEGEKQINYILELYADGTVGGTSQNAYASWKSEGNILRLTISLEGGEGYDEYTLSDNNTLTYTKRAGINSEGVWQEDMAGSDFFGGKFMEIYLQKR